jgi:stage II sporulation protein D
MITILIVSMLMALPPSDETVDIALLSLLSPRELSVSAAGSVAVTLRAEDGRVGRSFTLRAGEALDVIARADGLLVSLPGEPERLRIAAVSMEGDFDMTIALRLPHPWRRICRGRLTVSASRGVAQLVLRAPLEQVVAEVTAAELDAAHVPEAALMAQSVCVRSWLIAQRGSRGHGAAQFCDTTHCLLYRGRDGAFGDGGPGGLLVAEKAALATRGWVLAAGGRVVPAWFHASCGGATVAPADVWGADDAAGAIVAVPCPFCTSSATAAWEWEVAVDDLARVLQLPASGGKSQLKIGRERGKVSIACAGVIRTWNADTFRLLIGRVYGWDRLRSNRWQVRVEGGIVRFAGAGSGHGVGLCQEGAKAAAAAGWDWRRILRHWFPRCVLTTVP